MMTESEAANVIAQGIIDDENGDLDAIDTAHLFQGLIDNGMAWKLEGNIGRTAMSLIESGQCLLGEVGHRDYYGNYVPSRFEVEAGTKGSVEYQERMTDNEYTYTCSYCNSKLRFDGLVYIDSTSGDCCDGDVFGNNENELHSIVNYAEREAETLREIEDLKQ